MNALTTKYVGGSPEQDGNYIMFDLLTFEQNVAKVFTTDGVTRYVLSGYDHQVHRLDEIDTPNLRWIHIEPMTRVEMDKYLAVPTM